MKKILSFAKKPWVIVLLVILVAVIFILLGGRNTETANFETEVVGERDLREIVSELGIVEAEGRASLSFGASGVISDITVNEGEFVEEGQILARLSAPSLGYRVEEARARLAAEEARLGEMLTGLSSTERAVSMQTLENAELAYESAKDSYNLSEKEARTQTENARRALYSNNLTAQLSGGEREDSTRSYVAPIISGTYEGNREGNYTITLYPSHSDTGYSFRYTGLESGVGSVSTVKPEPLGKNGLYIIFPENFARNSDLEWIVEIPNRRSPNYASLRNALEIAELNERNSERRSDNALREAAAALELAKAQNELRLSGARSETIAAQMAGVSAARAGLNQAEAAYSDAIIRAPFSGTVASTAQKIGTRVSPGQEVINFVGTGKNQIVVYVPETDIARLNKGDTANVQFDAFLGEDFRGVVTFVSPVAISDQGVTRFKTVIELNEDPENLLTGLSADVDINTEERLNVIAVPSRAVVRESGRTFVRVKTEAGFKEIEVETGLRSTDGYTEIISGLSKGEEIITYISPQELTRLESAKSN